MEVRLLPLRQQHLESIVHFMSIIANSLPGVPLVESPLFNQLIDKMDLSTWERDVAIHLAEKGYVIVDFPDGDLDQRVARIKKSLAPKFDLDFDTPGALNAGGDHRIQDAWQYDKDVRAIAANDAIVELLGKLYGRRAIPFQTLNFPVGTQQHFHSDSIHFSSIPERFMCGVWLAMEDVTEAAGPLIYYPGSHRWPILTNEMLGRRASDPAQDTQTPYEPVWRDLVEASGIQGELFCPRKGQALIWAANLLHGGSIQKNQTLTRWSQVTHYYFADCTYFTPAYSDPFIGRLDVRVIRDVCTGAVVPNMYSGQLFGSLRASGVSFHSRKFGVMRKFERWLGRRSRA